MFFLNFSAVEFLSLLGVLGASITALYLLDRRKRRRVVSTLRFWTAAANVEERRSRRHMQQPWSLLLQLFSLLLLLLSLARLQWGSRPAQARDHVLLVDTSAWSAPVLRQEVVAARQFLRSLPPSDRALIVKTDALETASEPFTADRGRWAASLTNVVSTGSALDIGKAVGFAAAAQRWSGNAPGEIRYVGPARTDNAASSLPQNFRLTKIATLGENVGLRAASVRRNSDARSDWNASFTLRNDGLQPRTIHLQVGFAGTTFAPRRYTLAAHSELVAEYGFMTRTSGILRAAIAEPDSLISDNAVELTLQNNGPLRIGVVTRRRERLLPLLAAGQLFAVDYLDPGQYPGSLHPNVWIFDSFAPPRAVSVPALYIHPPRANSPVPVKATVREAPLSSWDNSIFGENGLHTHELRFPATDVFKLSPSDLAAASVAEGPAVVARSAPTKAVVIGFDLLSDAARLDLTTPLLMASSLSWLTPSLFQADIVIAEHIGAVTVPLESNEARSSLRVFGEGNSAIPFSIANGSIQLFSNIAQTIRIASDMHSREVNLSLPDVARGEWQPPTFSLASSQFANFSAPFSKDLWQWLAAAGGLSLLLEWILFGRTRRRLTAVSPPARRGARLTGKKQKERVSA